MKIEHYVEYLMPGLLFAEEQQEKLLKRDEKEALTRMPKGCFAFTLFDVEVRNGVLEDGSKIKDRQTVNRSAKFYPGGKLYTEDQVLKEHGEESILYSNMYGNGYKRLVKTRMGNWQPFEPEDRII